MREIKFRAWDSEKMIYQNNMQSISWPNHLKKECAVWVRCDFNNMGYFELMQYTGIKDKHGKEIYEGDIVNEFRKTRSFPDGNFFKRKIEWSDDMILDDAYGEKSIGFNLFHGELEIIGNIYENPELLK